MNWIVYAVTAWVMVGLELGLRDGLALGPSGSGPSFVFAFATFVAMFATPQTALWSSLILGLLVDLTGEMTLSEGRQVAVMIGPNALGYLLAGQFTLTLRGVMVRRNPLSMGFLAMVSCVVAQIVVVAIFTLRSTYDPLAFGASQQLVARLGTSVMTGGLALFLGLALVPMAPLFGLAAAQQRRFARR